MDNILYCYRSEHQDKQSQHLIRFSRDFKDQISETKKHDKKEERRVHENERN